MLDLQKLRYPKSLDRELKLMLVHLNRYHPIPLSKEVGISAVKMREILNGYDVPTAKLMDKLRKLQQEIRVAEHASNTHRR